MNRITATTFLLAAVTALPPTAMAANARNGETLAKRWCAACHVGAADQQRGSTAVPPFSEIAKKPGFDEARLAFYLLAPHPKMPDTNLSRSEVADLVAYISNQGQ